MLLIAIVVDLLRTTKVSQKGTFTKNCN